MVWQATPDAAVHTATANVDSAWLAAAGDTAHVRVGVPSDNVESVEVWLCAQHCALLCAQVATAGPLPEAAGAARYHACDKHEFAAQLAQLQHGAHVAELRGSVSAYQVCGLRGSTAGAGRAAARSAAAAKLAELHAGHCNAVSATLCGGVAAVTV